MSEAIEPSDAKALEGRQAQQSTERSDRTSAAIERAQRSNERSSASRSNVLDWFVVQSNPREEERARYFLEEKGFHAYLPRMETVSVRAFTSVTVQKPLFPGYLFCLFDPNESLAYVRWTKGVKKLLPESVNPVPITIEVLDAIRSLEQRDGVIRQQPLKKHDRVRIARGPLKDILGIFDHWASDQGRVRVLLNFVSYQASVELHHSLLEKVA